MKSLKCDKPIDIDAARKAKGLPRRKRDDPKSTAYELRIRIPSEYQGVLGRKRISRTVFARNKKDELRKKVLEFEEEANARLASALESAPRGGLAVASANCTERTSIGDYADRFLSVRSSGSISPYTLRKYAHKAKYVKALMGGMPMCDISATDVEECLLAIPRQSREWAEALRADRERNRAERAMKGLKCEKTPFSHIRVAGCDLQYEVLKFIRMLLDDAVERGILEKNVAAAKFLSKSFRKGRPLIDPLSRDEAAMYLRSVKELPLSPFKIACLSLLSSGLRPEEMLALRPAVLNLDSPSSARITGAMRANSFTIQEYTKTDSSRRTVPQDDYTAGEMKRLIWRRSRELRRMGITPKQSYPLIGEVGRPMGYDSFYKKWVPFVKDIGLGGIRPYALRHTFATLNLANGENIKTISVIMGHASASYTLDLYVGYLPSTSAELSNRYMADLDEAAAGCLWANAEEL